MTEESFKADWYLVEGVARVWDGEKWRRFKWAEAPGWYEFQGDEYYWDGKEWYLESDEEEAEAEAEDDENGEGRAIYSGSVEANYGSNSKSSNTSGIFLKIALTVILGFVLNFAWHLFTDSPSTESVCYTFSKATDSFLPEEESFAAAQWWDDNIKTEQDFERVDVEVISALKLYRTGEVLDDADPYNRMGLRDNVIDACESAEPGSTEH